MNKKRYTLILLFFFHSLFSQLNMNVKLINSIAHITIVNESEFNYLIPIDINHFRPYEENCDNFTEHESEFPSFGILLNIVSRDDTKVNYSIGYKYSDNFDSINDKRSIERKSFKRKIEQWRKKNKIEDYYISLINYKLINNLISLAPYEKKEFKIKLDLKNITAQELIFYNYFLEKNEYYKLFFSICSIESFKYLTPSQRNKYKKYKFFTGKLESNKIGLNN